MMRPEDILERARARARKRDRDWSVIALWGSIFVSLTMIAATMMWNLGKSLRVHAYLEEHGVESPCVELNLAPGQPAEAADEPLQRGCTELIAERHDTCLEYTAHLREDLRERRSEYVTCVMAQSSVERAALTN